MKFNGYLFSKLHLIGTKSEGNSYFLQKFDYSEVQVIRLIEHPWGTDPALHPFLDKKVTIEGKVSEIGIIVDNIKKYGNKSKQASAKPSKKKAK